MIEKKDLTSFKNLLGLKIYFEGTGGGPSGIIAL